jgi:aromatic ring-cleaving dioxygenase
MLLTPPSERTSSGPNAKAYINPEPTTKSPAYTSFTSPITNDTRGGFDIHIYFQQTSPSQTQYAKDLHERIRREFPELRIYSVFERPLGPHPIGMFEVNVFTPEQFGAFVSWLVVWRGPLSALIHPNTGDDLRDHSQRATW